LFVVCFGAPLYQGYGLTETLACGTISAADDSKVGKNKKTNTNN